jgi:hypothetical protein
MINTAKKASKRKPSPEVRARQVVMSNKFLSSYKLGHLLEIDGLKFMVKENNQNSLTLLAAEELVFRSARHREHFTKYLRETILHGKRTRQKLSAQDMSNLIERQAA